ncbi:MAG: NAD-dependent DNA ligase LigA [Candidatus Omnitrophica bacterium]|nr:NAD-dependent DNA ligase LigA [Candidatus Omnitrophota bacterium]
MAENIKKRIERLKKEILEHNRLYYTEGAPSISDSAYDGLMAELKELEKGHPEYATQDSPTRTVGAPVTDKLKKVRHIVPMLSLESVNAEDGATRFDWTCEKEAGHMSGYVCEPKFDGMSIELVYEKGELARGVTRGDGFIGEDVTLNVRTISNVPKKLKGKNVPDLLSVRGEVMMHISDFQELNRKQAEKGRDMFANPRNVVAGSMRQLDPEVTAARKLHVYVYQIMDISDGMPGTQKEALKRLTALGFGEAPDIEHCADIREAISYHHRMEEKRERMDYEIDGVVIKVDDIRLQEKLGMRTNNPKWAVAYKFKPRKEITRVENIIVQVGRTGTLTPLALLNPVEVGGVTVSRATLHNMDQIERLGVKIGDYVKVERAGDVIPYISGVLKEKRTGKEKDFRMPSKCPSCGGHIEKEDVFYRCPNGLSCPAQAKEAITHYASKDAADIEGLSEKTVALLYDRDIITGIASLYDIKREDLSALEGFKDRKMANILGAIEKSKDITLDRFLYGLGIKNVGKHIAKLIADKFGTLDRIMAATKEELVEINEIGPEIAESIVEWFSEKHNIAAVGKIQKTGVRIKAVEKKKDGVFSGKKVVFTGTMSAMSRTEAEKLVESMGGQASSSVGPGTDILVAGEKAGSKLDKAKKIGVKVLSEEEFIKMISR